MRSPRWLRRWAFGLVLLGTLHLLVAWPLFRIHWAAMPDGKGLLSLYFYLATGLWIAGSGFALGFVAESGKDPDAFWPGPFARGIANFLVIGGLIGTALAWREPAAGVLLVLSTAARLSARAPKVAPTA